MKIKELIKHLEGQLEECGDLPVGMVIDGEYSDIVGSYTFNKNDKICLLDLNRLEKFTEQE